MLSRFGRILQADGEFRFATDIPGYADYALERILRSPDLVWTARRADDWRKPWPGYTQTRYEAKAVREGRVPQYFIFRKVQ
jgi:tRNA (guanine-N7-)-methyltransferase